MATRSTFGAPCATTKKAGVAGLHLEDRPGRSAAVTSRKKSDTHGRNGRQNQAACDARLDDDFVIIARCDAIAVEGLGARSSAASAIAKPALTCCSSKRRSGAKNRACGAAFKGVPLLTTWRRAARHRICLRTSWDSSVSARDLSELDHPRGDPAMQSLLRELKEKAASPSPRKGGDVQAVHRDRGSTGNPGAGKTLRRSRGSAGVFVDQKREKDE